jgi:hypothetical protein
MPIIRSSRLHRWLQRVARNTSFEAGRVVCGRAVGYASGLRDVARSNLLPTVGEAGWVQGAVRTGAENLTAHRDSIYGPFSHYRDAIPTELPGPHYYHHNHHHHLVISAHRYPPCHNPMFPNKYFCQAVPYSALAWTENATFTQL